MIKSMRDDINTFATIFHNDWLQQRRQQGRVPRHFRSSQAHIVIAFYLYWVYKIGICKFYCEARFMSVITNILFIHQSMYPYSNLVLTIYYIIYNLSLFAQRIFVFQTLSP